ncbi:hypothetical protein CSW98_03550 [Vibrio sp. HA2012]|uniref:hypothetical protein n=1 Tax=Vibrio sp. HA2012 TaxID=1971595 RepID=UPI000C2BA161|nr:hypothetical protein [Vibrio sp. HA2012]PJC88205.1 hypothetical protein CSW98_03550 [Vibrio sp. HA2012]
MKFFKFLIVGFTLAIGIIVAIFGIKTEDDTPATGKSETIDAINISPETEQNEMQREPEVVAKVHIPILSERERAAMPPFIQAMPVKPFNRDSNHNWFRDDLELYIAYKFPYSPKSRAAYTQMAKILDRMGTDSGQTQTPRQVTLWKEEQLALKCFYDTGFTDDELEELKRIVFDSEHMREGYQMVIDKRQEIPANLAKSIVIPEDACDPILWENEVTLQEWKPEKTIK